MSVSKTGRDFELSYSVKSEKIRAHCIREEDIDDPNSGSLCLFITPPASLSTTFGRAFFFLLDRSGSMIGEPFPEATRALNRALDRLRPSDQFNVCAFDHRQNYYQPFLCPANNENLSSNSSETVNNTNNVHPGRTGSNSNDANPAKTVS